MFVLKAVLATQQFSVVPNGTAFEVFTNITDCHFGASERIAQSVWFTYEAETYMFNLGRVRFENNVSRINLRCEDIDQPRSNCKRAMQDMTSTDFMIFSNVSGDYRYDLAVAHLNQRPRDIGPDSIHIMFACLGAFVVVALVLFSSLICRVKRQLRDDDAKIQVEAAQFSDKIRQIRLGHVT